ncbi:MAG: hypothetical protein ACI835_004789 [Planctomycetota bacterium]
MLADMTLTPGAGDYLVFFVGGFSNATTGGDDQFIVSIYVNGSQIAETEQGVFTKKGKQQSVAAQYKVTGLLAGQSIEVYWRTVGGRNFTTINRSLILMQTD